MKRWILTAVLTGLIVGVSGAGAAEAERERPKRADRPPRARQMDPERMKKAQENARERLLEILRKDMQVQTDEEWEIIKERVLVVERLRRAEMLKRYTGRKVLWAARAMKQGGGKRPPELDERLDQFIEEQPDLADHTKALLALAEILAQENALDEEIKERLDAVRKAEDDFAKKLAKAQEELRQILNRRQESVLVLHGLLD
jgi:hypothetical protein